MNSNKKNILVIGSTGLLGSMVFDFFLDKGYNICGTYHKKRLSEFYKYSINEYSFDASGNIEKQLDEVFLQFEPHYIINCIGIIKLYCKDDDVDGIYKAIEINAFFPHKLSKYLNKKYKECKIIQIATDCVFDGLKGNYSELDLHNAIDVYGKSKSLGEVNRNNVLNIRCSIIGPEIHNYLSLMEWFLSNKPQSKINGFTHHLWNGVTTLQFAQFCKEIIDKDLFAAYKKFQTPIHLVMNESVSKYRLLNIFQEVFQTDYQIIEKNEPPPKIDRTLTSDYLKFTINAMQNSIEELKEYMLHSKIYSKKWKKD
jgi:dTDP-4-dehydrorhamnose reductase